MKMSVSGGSCRCSWVSRKRVVRALRKDALYVILKWVVMKAFPRQTACLETCLGRFRTAGHVFYVHACGLEEEGRAAAPCARCLRSDEGGKWPGEYHLLIN